MYPSLATITVCGFPLDYVAPLFTPPPALPIDTQLMIMGVDSLAYLYAEADDKVANGTGTSEDEALLIAINREMARRKRMRDIVAELRTIYAGRPWYRDDPFSD